jgi:hypothetical protein
MIYTFAQFQKIQQFENGNVGGGEKEFEMYYLQFKTRLLRKKRRAAFTLFSSKINSPSDRKFSRKEI